MLERMWFCGESWFSAEGGGGLVWWRGRMPLYSSHPMTTALSPQFDHDALKNYLLDHAYDEMFSGPGDLHEHYEPLLEHFSSLPTGELAATEAGGGPELSESGDYVYGVWARGGDGEDFSV